MNEMISNLLASYGWWLLALLLIAAELLAPGISCSGSALRPASWVWSCWFSRAAVLAQAVVFVVLSIAVYWVYWQFVRPAAELRNDQPLLNRKVSAWSVAT